MSVYFTRLFGSGYASLGFRIFLGTLHAPKFPRVRTGARYRSEEHTSELQSLTAFPSRRSSDLTQLTGTFLGVAAFQVGAQSRFQRGSSRSGSSHERLLYSSLWFWLCQFRISDFPWHPPCSQISTS